MNEDKYLQRLENQGINERLEEENLAFDAEIKELKAKIKPLEDSVLGHQYQHEVDVDEIKELKGKIYELTQEVAELNKTIRRVVNIASRRADTIEDLRAKLLERDEKVKYLKKVLDESAEIFKAMTEVPK